MLDKKIQDVLEKLGKQSDYEEENHSEIPHEKRMLAITRETGEFYNILLKSINAKKILEVGTSVGYSTLWFADAILSNTDSGKIIAIDEDKAKIQRATKNFEEAGVNIVEFKQGKAADVLSKLEEDSFDFVFIDADKESYIQYFDLCLPLVKKGGMIGADNILLPERFQKFSKPYVAHVRANQGVQSVTVPIGNGEEVTLKL